MFVNLKKQRKKIKKKKKKNEEEVEEEVSGKTIFLSPFYFLEEQKKELDVCKNIYNFAWCKNMRSPDEVKKKIFI